MALTVWLAMLSSRAESMLPHVKLAFRVIVGLAIVLLVLCFSIEPDARAGAFNLLICCSGVATGWFAGFLTSPINPAEKKKFSSATRIVSAFISGYILSKFDSILAIVKQNPLTLDHYFVAHLLFFLSCLILAALLVYYLRAYDAK